MRRREKKLQARRRRRATGFVPKQSQRRHAVHVVIAEEHDALTVIDGVKNPLNRLMHSTDQEWVGESGEPRI